MLTIKTRYGIHELDQRDVWILSRLEGSSRITSGSGGSRIGWFCTRHPDTLLCRCTDLTHHVRTEGV